MEKDPLINQDVLATRIKGFLADHFEHWFTVEELASEQAISGPAGEIQERIETLLKEGQVRAEKKDGEWSFQAVLIDR